MNISFYDSSVVPAIKAISNLRDLMAKGAAHAAANGVAEADLMAKKLADDMFDLGMQMTLVRVLACDEGLLKVVGLDATPGPHEIKSFADADTVLANIVSDLGRIDADQFNASMQNKVFATLPPGCAHFNDCLTFVQGWAMPHLYFHVTAAYCILRNNGVALGKGDYLGALEMEMVPHAQ
jgi:hypothetical protein